MARRSAARAARASRGVVAMASARVARGSGAVAACERELVREPPGQRVLGDARDGEGDGEVDEAPGAPRVADLARHDDGGRPRDDEVHRARRLVFSGGVGRYHGAVTRRPKLLAVASCLAALACPILSSTRASRSPSNLTPGR